MTITIRGQRIDDGRASQLLNRLRQVDLSPPGAAFAHALERSLVDGEGELDFDTAEAHDVFYALDAWLLETDRDTIGEALLDLREELAGLLGIGKEPKPRGVIP